MFVQNYMTPDPLVISTGEKVERIAELIRVRGIRQVPVVDAANRLVGIVTDRDIRSAIGFEGKDELDLIAEDLMSTDLVTIAPGAELLEAAQLLHKHHFGALPVVLGEYVIGMITTHDLLRCLIGFLEEHIAEPSQLFKPTRHW